MLMNVVLLNIDWNVESCASAVLPLHGKPPNAAAQRSVCCLLSVIPGCCSLKRTKRVSHVHMKQCTCCAAKTRVEVSKKLQVAHTMKLDYWPLHLHCWCKHFTGAESMWHVCHFKPVRRAKVLSPFVRFGPICILTHTQWPALSHHAEQWIETWTSSSPNTAKDLWSSGCRIFLWVTLSLPPLSLLFSCRTALWSQQNPIWRYQSHALTHLTSFHFLVRFYRRDYALSFWLQRA